MPDNISGKLAELAALFRTSRRIVFLTGAGMSTESGIPDFRSAQGLYASGVSDDVFDIGLFRRKPEHFYAFARQFLGEIRRARPNAGHLAIAALEYEFGKEVTVATQNIDTLHQEAGSGTVYPLHGTLDYCCCTRCAVRVPSRELWPVIERGEVPRHASCNGVFKPEIVFFGELLSEEVVAAAEDAVRAADLLVIAGTSLVVYPAAALPGSRGRDCRLVIINRSPTALDDRADCLFADSIGEVLTAALAELRNHGQ